MDSTRRTFAHVVTLALLCALQGCATIRSSPLLAKDPLSAEEHVLLGKTYESQGDNAGAIKHYDAALRKDSQHAGALYSRGTLALQADDFKRARKLFRRLLKENPSHIAGYNNAALTELALGHPKTAEKLLQRALALTPSPDLQPYLYETYGQVLQELNQSKEADAMYDKALATATSESLRDQIRASRGR